MKLITGQVVFFSDTHNCVTAQHHLKSNSPQNNSLEEPDHSVLRFVDIIEYVDGRPPLLVYTIHCKPKCSLELKFFLDGLQESNQFTLRRQSQLPGICDDNKLFCIMNKFCLIELRPAIPQRTTSMSRASSKSQGGVHH